MKILINKKTNEILVGNYWYEVLVNPTLQPLLEVAEVEAEDSSFDEAKINDYQNWKTTFDAEKNELVYKQIIIDQLPIARQKKLAELTAYDSSTAVNSFTINGIAMWLSKEERNSLYRLATACKNMGLKTMPLQLPDGSFVEFHPDNVLLMLDALEVYAGASFGVTGNKKIEIKAMTTIEEFEAYDVTSGYPNKLNF